MSDHRTSWWTAPASRITRLPGGLRKRTVLRLGFGVIMILLVIAGVLSYKIQKRTARAIAETYSRYIQQTDALTEFHHNFLMGEINLRDLLLSERADSLQFYKDNLARLRERNNEALATIKRLSGVNVASNPLAAHSEEFWDTLEAVYHWPASRRDSLGYEFLQQEIVPRGNRAWTIVGEWITKSESGLQDRKRELDLSRDQASRKIIIVLGLCLLSGLIVAWFSLGYSENLERESARQYEEVESAKRELEQLSARLLEVQEEERRSLSRELHDEIGQTLTALRIEISHAHAQSPSPGVRERLDRARSLAERTVKSVRNISLLLRPSLLDDLGLAPALQCEVEDFTRRTGIRCTLVDGGISDALPDILKTSVYRVVQEALNNCQKHSGATRVNVSLRQTPSRILARIEDDGKGFEVKRGIPVRARCLGILGMRERAVMLGGSLVLDAAPGKGTRVTLELPIPAGAAITINREQEVRS